MERIRECHREVLEEIAESAIMIHMLNSEKIHAMTRNFSTGMLITEMDERSIINYLRRDEISDYNDLFIQEIYGESIGEYVSLMDEYCSSTAYSAIICVRNKEGFRTKKGFSFINILFTRRRQLEYGILVVINNEKTTDFASHSYRLIEKGDETDQAAEMKILARVAAEDYWM